MDEEAKQRYKGKFEPYMVKNVRSSNGLGAYDNVVVCEEGSIIEITINSWGTCGYGYSICSERDVIIDKLYVTFGKTPRRTVSSTIRRYQNSSNMITVSNYKSLNLPTSQIVEYQKVWIKSWDVYQYTENGADFKTEVAPPPPPPVALGALLPGESIISAIPHKADKLSAQTFGEISDVKAADSDRDALGQVVLYFFVFKDHEKAKQVIEVINGPDQDNYS